MRTIEKARERLLRSFDNPLCIAAQEGWLLDLFALLVLTKGGTTTREDVQDALDIWVDHQDLPNPALLPFARRVPGTNRVDEYYLRAIQNASYLLQNESRVHW